MKVISIAIGLLFLGLGIPMVSGKAENFVVGSASPDNELRNNFDTKKLCRIFGIYLIFLSRIISDYYRAVSSLTLTPGPIVVETAIFLTYVPLTVVGRDFTNTE